MWPFGTRLRFEPAMGDAAAKRLRADLARRDWRAASEFLATVEHPDDRAFYLRQAGEVGGVETWIREWIEAEPRSNTPLLVAAQRYIAWAWEARGAKRARYVKDEQFKLFFQRLQDAESALHLAARLDDDDPAPWAFMVTTARGLQCGQDEAFARFHEATGRYPWHFVAHMQLLQQVCPKWGGSFEALHAFTGRAISEMPDGSSLGVLAAYAHIEHWHDLEVPEDGEYLKRPEVRADLNAAADRSVRHPRYIRRPGWPLLHNWFAAAFSFVRDWESANEQFTATEGLVTALPWEYTLVGALTTAKSGYASQRRRVRRRIG